MCLVIRIFVVHLSVLRYRRNAACANVVSRIGAVLRPFFPSAPETGLGLVDCDPQTRRRSDLAPSHFASRILPSPLQCWLYERRLRVLVPRSIRAAAIERERAAVSFFLHLLFLHLRPRAPPTISTAHDPLPGSQPHISATTLDTHGYF